MTASIINCNDESPDMAPVKPLLFASVGTDHHPFDRLVEWVDGWAAANAEHVDCVVQFGTSRAPVHAKGHAYLDYERMVALLRRATIVVCHGGPATIMDCRAAGSIPIVLPRRSAYGEHVDDHQVLFTRHLVDKQQIVLGGDRLALHAAFEWALTQPSWLRSKEDIDSIALTVERFGDLVAAVGGPRRRAWSRRRALRNSK